MKKIILGLLALVLASTTARAADDPAVYRVLENFVVTALTSGSSTVATPIASGRFVVRLFSTTDAFVAFASTKPFASPTTGFALVANIPEYIRVNQGEFIAVRASSSVGTLHIGQMGR